MRNIFLTILTLPTLIVVALWSSLSIHPVLATITGVDVSNPAAQYVAPYAVAVAILVYVAIGVVYQKTSPLNMHYFTSDSRHSLGSATLRFFLDIVARLFMLPLLISFLGGAIVLTVVLFQNAGTQIPNLIASESSPEVSTLRQTLLCTGLVVLVSRGAIGRFKKRRSSSTIEDNFET